MWKPSINFITLHYSYIILASIASFIIIYPYGNLKPVDAFFFGASACTESGLNTFDVKDLKTYQQLVIYFFPIITNIGVVNIVVAAVRLHWFNNKFKQISPSLRRTTSRTTKDGLGGDPEVAKERIDDTGPVQSPHRSTSSLDAFPTPTRLPHAEDGINAPQEDGIHQRNTTIAFAPDAHPKKTDHDAVLHVPGPRERDEGLELIEMEASKDYASNGKSDNNEQPRGRSLPLLRHTLSIERVASSMFVIGAKKRPQRSSSTNSKKAALDALPMLSPHVTVGRNSTFYNLTEEDKEMLGGIEYRALKLLVKITIGYYVGLHLLGAICLVPWIHNAPSKYTDYLIEVAQGKTWWAFYSSQTMINNLGFTLTPDSMIHFRDAQWPIFVMTFLAFAGNTCYPILLRLVIWVMSKVAPRTSALHEPLQFLLNYPRRCCTLLFPSKPTWILFGVLFVLNFVDTILIIVLDLDNPEVNVLPTGPRILAALFQAASSRHTGTATFNLYKVNPAVQFSLLVMMYISVFPIAISVRASNTYEEKSLGIYSQEDAYDESDSRTYITAHLRNQLSFDLWYIFLGAFCITIAQSYHIADELDPAFNIFAIVFEVTSAYGNVGLSLGHPTVNTSLSGKMTTFSKLVICAMMIRGRHRMLPNQLDRAIMLPRDSITGPENEPQASLMESKDNCNYATEIDQTKLKRHYTK